MLLHRLSRLPPARVTAYPSVCLVPLTSTETVSSVLDMETREAHLKARLEDLGMSPAKAKTLAAGMTNIADRANDSERLYQETLDERDNIVCEAATNGMPYREIAAWVDISHQRISQLVRGEA